MIPIDWTYDVICLVQIINFAKYTKDKLLNKGNTISIQNTEFFAVLTVP